MKYTITITTHKRTTFYHLVNESSYTVVHSSDPAEFIQACRKLYGVRVGVAVVDQRAVDLFASTEGLTLDDAYKAAVYELKCGPARLARVLRLVAADGCDFATAATAIEEVDSFLMAA